MCANEEKRRISRADYVMKGQARYKDRFFKGEIKDFSLNGFLFYTDEAMRVSEGEKLVITVKLDDEAQDIISEIDCTVIRIVGSILGLKFDVIDYDTLMYLKEKLIHIIGDENKINDEFMDFLEGK